MPAQAGVTSYQYDTLGRLTQASYLKGSKATQRNVAYGFDPRGNRTQKAVTSTTGPGGGTSNHAPVAVNDTLLLALVGEDSGLYGFRACFDPRENDTDADNDVLSITSGWDAGVGCYEVDLTAEQIESFSDSFSYSISDGHGGTASATVSVGIA